MSNKISIEGSNKLNIKVGINVSHLRDFLYGRKEERIKCFLFNLIDMSGILSAESFLVFTVLLIWCRNCFYYIFACTAGQK